MLTEMDDKQRATYQERAQILKAMAHPTRLWMIEMLAAGERCVCEFANVIDADFSTTSKHLSILKQAGIIEATKRGKQVYYRLKVPCVLNFMNCVEAVLKSHIESRTAMLK